MKCLNCSKEINAWSKTDISFPESILFCNKQCEEQWAYTASDIQVDEVHNICKRIEKAEYELP